MPIPVLSVAKMRQWEQASWDAGRSQVEVINRAGREAASVALQMTRPGDQILILAGRGHNGDDARAAQPHLRRRKIDLRNISDPVAALTELDSLLAAGPALVMDGLFGIGLNRPLDKDWAELIERLNNASLPVLAIDVPSGLNADTGEPQNVALRALATVTFGAPKPGFLRPSSAEFTGRLIVAPEIGLLPCAETSDLQWTLPEDFAGFPPARPVDGHKGTFGHVAILAGSEGYHGAAVLAARGALRACPGLVTVFVTPAAYIPVASQLQAAMVHPFRPGSALPSSCTGLVIGPGLAGGDVDETWRNFLREQWRTATMPVVVDASALAWIEPGPLTARAPRILTPHPGEAARLLATDSRSIQKDRAASLRTLSREFGDCWVILKGNHTLVGRSEGDLVVNSSGNPWLAQGGSGDALAGYLGGLMAQPALQSDPAKTLRYAVWEHGATADRLSRRKTPWTLEDLLQRIGASRAFSRNPRDL